MAQDEDGSYDSDAEHQKGKKKGSNALSSLPSSSLYSKCISDLKRIAALERKEQKEAKKKADADDGSLDLQSSEVGSRVGQGR